MMRRLKPVAALLAAAFAALAHAEQPTTLKEVTVTATSQAEGERQAAVTQKTVIDRQKIEALGGLTVGEVIRKLP
ncbi:MAG: TonB-dependent receptor, partial [Azonexus sp.]|nr:TonB-dependent receptor [Azonexus sp.]